MKKTIISKNRKEWNEKYGELHRKSQKRYADKHREYYRLKNIISNQKQQDTGYHKKKQREYYDTLKMKARNFTNRNKLRKNHCELCTWLKYFNSQYGIYINPYLGDESILEGHHPNYDKYELNITLCKLHHNEIPR